MSFGSFFKPKVEFKEPVIPERRKTMIQRPVKDLGCECQNLTWKEMGACDMHLKAGRGKYV